MPRDTEPFFLRGVIVVSIRGISGVLLLILSVLKVIGLAVVLWRGNPGHTTLWIVKQCVYVIAFGTIGLGLVRQQDEAHTRE